MSKLLFDRTDSIVRDVLGYGRYASVRYNLIKIQKFKNFSRRIYFVSCEDLINFGICVESIDDPHYYGRYNVCVYPFDGAHGVSFNGDNGEENPNCRIRE